MTKITRVLIVAGFFFSPSGNDASIELTNRGLEVLAVWGVAILVFAKKEGDGPGCNQESGLRDVQERCS